MAPSQIINLNSYYGLVIYKAKKLYNKLPEAVRNKIELNDLIQEGLIGLVNAANRYDPKREASFSKADSLKPQKEDSQNVSGKDLSSKQMTRDKTRHELNRKKNIGAEKILLLCIFLPQFSILNRVLTRIWPVLTRFPLFSRIVTSFFQTL